MNILVLNAGSSSQKSSLYRFEGKQLPTDPLAPIWEGAIDFGHAGNAAELSVTTASGASWAQSLEGGDRTAATEQLLQTLWQGPTAVIEAKENIHAVGHRVVHGGHKYPQAVLIDESVKATIDELIPLAPAHNPANLAGVQTAEDLLGTACPQFAVFDTAFHQTLPPAAALYPVPQSWIDKGIRRYGFHGISHQYCAHRAAYLLKKSLDSLRLVICHLGNGCSLCAVDAGRSIDTTMGFTPLDGLMMGTRSGSVDPSILTYMIRAYGYSGQQIDQALNKESGLKGVSGLSGDMREIILAMQQGNDKAKLAFDMYIHRLRAEIAAMTASMKGLDGLVFTAGVGEHAAIVRTSACEGLSFLGLAVSARKNSEGAGDRVISADASAVPVLVIHTREDWQIATQYWQLRQEF
ncbi:MAG: acetate kinase [Phormidesmis sp.]